MDFKTGLAATLPSLPFLAACESSSTTAAKALAPGAYEVTFSGSLGKIPLLSGNGPGAGPWNFCLTGSPHDNPDKLVRGILAESDNGKGDVQIKRNGSHITGSTTLTLDPDRAVGTAKFSFDGNIFTDGFEGDLTQHLEIEKPSDPQGASAAQLMNSTTLHLKGRFTGKCSAEQQEAVKKWEDKTQAQDDPAEKAADQPAEETDDQAAKAAADAAAESDETN